MRAVPVDCVEKGTMPSRAPGVRVRGLSPVGPVTQVLMVWCQSTDCAPT